MLVTRGTPINSDKPASLTKSSNESLRSLLSKTWQGVSKRGQAARDQASTTSTVQENEGSLEGKEEQEQSLLFEQLHHSLSRVSSSRSFSVYDENSDDLHDDQKACAGDALSKRCKKKEEDANGEDKLRRRSTMKRQESQRVVRRRNSITVMSTETFKYESEKDAFRHDLDASSQHSLTNAARSDRRRTTRPRRHSLGYGTPSPQLSTEPSEFKDMMQKRLDRIEQQKNNSDLSFNCSQPNLYGYEGEGWHDSSSNLNLDSHGKRRCGRRARRHSIGSVSTYEGSALQSKGTTNVDPDYGYEDPDALPADYDDFAPTGRQVRHAPRRVRRLSIGHSVEKNVEDDQFLDSAVDQQRVAAPRRERRRSMHF
ncbi:hypothetical protein FisN_22Hu015 [Fistulifera solaris]|uniref:Uncharacterized protein n=1 Tax=Fistulifera solaris TaxID=1519565 RepID=A0A1Z5K2P0_FISSO|nr:hypothetical protein FisN_22Hu015 [Fistulifera solaris]|eukprot:GAX20449.1 hypothetical protein FisN_22Hu015 [Fistulifera solaris]